MGALRPPATDLLRKVRPLNRMLPILAPPNLPPPWSWLTLGASAVEKDILLVSPGEEGTCKGEGSTEGSTEGNGVDDAGVDRSGDVGLAEELLVALGIDPDVGRLQAEGRGAERALSSPSHKVKRSSGSFDETQSVRCQRPQLYAP